MIKAALIHAVATFLVFLRNYIMCKIFGVICVIFHTENNLYIPYIAGNVGGHLNLADWHF